ncbi:phosphotransferase [Corynebacterium pseudopelargi]|uniref:Maltokinase n=1 Tax=Corynebacterium pseudopelargi TaxID=2080757 RepID=A0A3G6IVU1_9CORY|nr:phosphotransferase [Corynebacterium pseudopelargi]AZA08788.1 Maltokinase [Corynebacterium pseudopelargi]
MSSIHIAIGKAQWALQAAPGSKQHAQYEQTLRAGQHDCFQQPAYVQGLLRAWREHPAIQFHGDRRVVDKAMEQLEAISGQQTNASLHTAASMWKFYRSISPGVHPDVEIPQVVRAHVPAYQAHVSIEIAGQNYTLAVATQFIPNATDAWSLGTSHKRALLLDHSADMGRALKDIHHDLRTKLPTSTVAGRELAQHMHARAEAHIAQAPELRPYAERIHASFDALEGSIATQRIHGDLHLGQVLWANGWHVVDFEGEPDQSLSQRTALLPVAYDLAGLIRSFHYAGLDYPSELLAAYGRIDEILVHACVVDRFAYEVAYEKRHRPDWVAVPLRDADALFADALF